MSTAHQGPRALGFPIRCGCRHAGTRAELTGPPIACGQALTWGPVKASPQEQLRLLELADLDAELGRLQHRRRALPELAEVERLEARDAEVRDAIVAAETEVGDLA